jgi:hypothetical protein
MEYEDRISGLFNHAMKACVSNPALVPDAAAIIQHGPIVAGKVGDLADQDARVRRAVDFITSGTENPYISLALAAMPLVMQIVRNHEMTEAATKRHLEMKIPWTKWSLKIPMKFRLKNKWLRSITHHPDELTMATFSNPAIRTALAEAGIEVAWMDPRETNGRQG